MYGHTDVTAYLIDNGADVNERSHDGMTALMWAALHGHVSTLQRLLALGAVVKDADNFGRTPLIFAAMGGDEACVRSLLSAGASRGIHDEVRTPWGSPYTHDAAWRGRARAVPATVTS